MTTSTIPTGRFVWFDYLTTDQNKAKGFFGEVFGWGTKAMPIPGGGGEYTMITIGDEPIGGYMAPPPGAPTHSHWVSNLQVADVRATVEKAKSLGATIKKPPTDMGMGTWSILGDPQGAVVALWQPAQVQGSGDYKGVPGAFCWNELTAPDADKAVAFYQAIGGFEHASMDMGGGNLYHLLNSDGKGRAGVTKPMMPGQPTAWLPYVQVASADATFAKATKLGANAFVPPTDIPNVGRFSIFADSVGGAIGILQPAPDAPK